MPLISVYAELSGVTCLSTGTVILNLRIRGAVRDEDHLIIAALP